MILKEKYEYIASSNWECKTPLVLWNQMCQKISIEWSIHKNDKNEPACVQRYGQEMALSINNNNIFYFKFYFNNTKNNILFHAKLVPTYTNSNSKWTFIALNLPKRQTLRCNKQIRWSENHSPRMEWDVGTTEQQIHAGN